MHQQNVIIDCDTGVDDAMALSFALRAPGFNVLGITTVAGNVPLHKVTRNTLVIVELAGRQTPVYRGMDRPLIAPLVTAEYAHGNDGLGNVGFPEPQSQLAEEHAVDFLIRSFMEATVPITLITLAPLTNIAMALLKEPRLEEHIPHIVMMAGGITGGNTTAAAEFNVYVDPEAADIVFRSRIPKTMVGLEPIYEGGLLHDADVTQIEACPSPWCWAVGRLLRQNLDRWKDYTGETHPARPPDLAAMAVALEPGLATSKMLHVAVETQGQHTRGMTVVDNRRYRFDPQAPEANVNVVTAIDNTRYQALVLNTLLA